MQTLVEVSEECIAKVLIGPIVSESAGDESLRVDVVEDMEEGGQRYLSSTSVKKASGVENSADSLKLPSGSPLKRSAGVAFKISAEEELLCEVDVSGKRR